MDVTIRKYKEEDLPRMAEVWNQVVAEGNAFPQETCLSIAEAGPFFSSQTYCGVAEVQGQIMGLYILHPNNIGRCGHIANASYAVRSGCRGQHIGEKLVRDCMQRAQETGFRILQFNAVVASNEGAIKLYERLGFSRIGRVEGGFCNKDGTYEDIILFYIGL